MLPAVNRTMLLNRSLLFSSIAPAPLRSPFAFLSLSLFPPRSLSLSFDCSLFVAAMCRYFVLCVSLSVLHKCVLAFTLSINYTRSCLLACTPFLSFPLALSRSLSVAPCCLRSLALAHVHFLSVSDSLSLPPSLVRARALCLFVCLSICLSVCLSVCLFVYLFVCLSVCPSVCLSVHLSICLSVFQSICLCACICVCLSVYLSADLSVCIFFSLPFTHFLSQPFSRGTLLTHTFTAYPTCGDIFESGFKAQSSKLKRLFCHVLVKSNIRV